MGGGLVVVAALLVTGCSSSPKVVAPQSQLQSLNQLRPGLSVCVLSPLLTYEAVSTAQSIDASRLGGHEVEADLIQAASDALTACGCKVQRMTETSDSGLDLSSESDDLLRAVKSQSTLERLRAFGKGSSVDAVLIQFFKVKLGPSGSWDPWSGTITSAMNSSHLRAAVIEASNKAALWQGSVYLREIPRIEDKHYRRAVELLYPKSATPKETRTSGKGKR